MKATMKLGQWVVLAMMGLWVGAGCVSGQRADRTIGVKIEGDVLHPGEYVVEEGTTLGELLDKAEPGPSEGVFTGPMLGHVKLWRVIDGKGECMRHNCWSGKPGRDVVLQNGDEIYLDRYF